MNIDVWSDIVCPWCYIGKRRLETALSRFEHRDKVTLTWRSYQLSPDAPKVATETTLQMLARKYGVSTEEAEAMQTRVRDVAAQEGLQYRLDLTRSENSLDAHRLLHLAREHGKQDALKEHLFAGYFLEGASIGDADTLLRMATDAGLDKNAAAQVLAGDQHADAVRADIAQARAIGVQGVPFFVLGGRYGLSGAQPADTLLQALSKAWDESEGSENRDA